MLTLEQMQAEIARLSTLNAELTKKNAENASGGFKVSEKGAFSMYSLGRLPVTLYGTQWAKLAERLPEMLAFIKANETHPKVIEAVQRKANPIK